MTSPIAKSTVEESIKNGISHIDAVHKVTVRVPVKNGMINYCLGLN